LDAILNFSKCSRVTKVHPVDSENGPPGLPKTITKNLHRHFQVHWKYPCTLPHWSWEELTRGKNQSFVVLSYDVAITNNVLFGLSTECCLLLIKAAVGHSASRTRSVATVVYVCQLPFACGPGERGRGVVDGRVTMIRRQGYMRR